MWSWETKRLHRKRWCGIDAQKQDQANEACQNKIGQMGRTDVTALRRGDLFEIHRANDLEVVVEAASDCNDTDTNERIEWRFLCGQCHGEKKELSESACC